MANAQVLLVDDDESILDLLQAEFARAGIDAARTTSAEEGLARMCQHLYPVVVLDIAMPGLNGVEMLRRLKQYNSLVQVIMLTATASMTRVIECLDAGAADFFSKNDPRDGVIEAVRGALAREERWVSWMGAHAHVG